METKKRRDLIINMLKSQQEPISGASLATKLNVTRQVIVQDIALLRAQKYNILSTSRGYLLYQSEKDISKRLFPVQHSKDNIRDELCTIIDLGGTVLDVVIDHTVYGEITVNLLLKTREDIENFMTNLGSNDDIRPLMYLTGGEHYHTVEAESEAVLDKIENKLLEKGYLFKY